MESSDSDSVETLRKRPHYSHSAMQTYLTCSLAFYFRYIKKLESTRISKCLLFGKAFHMTLDRVAAMKMAGISVDAQQAQDIFSGEWKAQVALPLPIDFDSPEEADRMNEQGRQMIAAYLSVWNDKKILAHSKAFILELVDEYGSKLSKPIIGEYDLIIEEDGLPVIVDFKTAGKKWTDAKLQKDLQSVLYCLAYQSETGTLPSFRFDVITKTKVPAVYQLQANRSEDDFKRLTKLYLSIDSAIQKGVFLPCGEDYMCSGCDYASACASWHRSQ